MALGAQQLGVAIALVSIAAFFAALAIAYGATLRGAPPQIIEFPRALYFSTAFLAASSGFLEAARYAARRARVAAYRRRLDLALACGAAFVLAQLAAWADLWRQDVTLRANPRASIYFAFTGFHALHVAGGIAALLRLRRGSRDLRPDAETPLRQHRITAGAAALYWHFMGALWLALLLLLVAWR